MAETLYRLVSTRKDVFPAVLATHLTSKQVQVVLNALARECGEWHVEPQPPGEPDIRQWTLSLRERSLDNLEGLKHTFRRFGELAARSEELLRLAKQSSWKNGSIRVHHSEEASHGPPI